MVFDLTRTEVEPKSTVSVADALSIWPLLGLDIDSETKPLTLSQNPAYATKSVSFYA